MHSDFTHIEQLAERQRLEQVIADAQRRIREMTGKSPSNGKARQADFP
jgi:hypothetical protein